MAKPEDDIDVRVFCITCKGPELKPALGANDELLRCTQCNELIDGLVLRISNASEYEIHITSKTEELLPAPKAAMASN